MMLSGQGAVRMRWGTDASGRRPPYLTRLISRVVVFVAMGVGVGVLSQVLA